jgi:hypothetical protein
MDHDELLLMKTLLDTTEIPEELKRNIVALAWTCEEVPEIETSDMLKAYKLLAAKLEQDAPADIKAYADWTGTPSGRHFLAYTARIDEWADAGAGDD